MLAFSWLYFCKEIGYDTCVRYETPHNIQEDNDMTYSEVGLIGRMEEALRVVKSLNRAQLDSLVYDLEKEGWYCSDKWRKRAFCIDVIISNWSYTITNSYTCKAGAIIECIISNRSYAIRNNKFC